MKPAAAEAVRHLKNLQEAYRYSVRPYIIRDTDATYVYLKGSETLVDWLKDLDANPVNFPGTAAKAHEGFLSLFRDCYNERLLADFYSTERVVIAGHSLGGALAQMYALALGNDHPRARISVHTFGAPRVGDALFSYLYNRRVQNACRWVLDKDPIPCLPAWGYRHTQGLLHVANDGQEIKPFGSFMRQLRYWVGFRPHDFGDHGLEAYEGAIRAWGGI